MAIITPTGIQGTGSIVPSDITQTATPPTLATPIKTNTAPQPTPPQPSITENPDANLLALGITPEQMKALNTPNGLDPASFAGLINSVETKLKTNNELVTQRGYLIKHLYDAPLTPDELAKLPTDIQSVVGSGNKDAIELQLRLLNDQISGRANTLSSSISTLTSGYKTAVEQAQQQRKDAISNIQNFVSAYGSRAPAALKALYGQDYIDQLKAQGIDIDAFSKLSPQTISEQRYAAQYGIPGGTIVNIPQGTIASSTNNPLNIKFIDGNLYGGTDSGIAAQDGGTFAAFSSPQEGLAAAVQLLRSPNYNNLTIDEAMKRWSNNGYGADIAPEFSPTQKMSSLSNTQLQQVVSDMAQRESGTTISEPTIVDQDTLKGMLDYYHTTGLVPAMGLGVNSPLRKAFWQAIGTEGVGFVSEAAKNKAGLSAATKALGTQENQLAAAKTAIGTMDKQLSLLKDYSDKVDRTGSPIVNKYALYLKGQVQGDPDTQALQNIVQTASYEFAKILSGSSASIAGVSVTSAEDAKNLLNANMTPEQINKIVNLMQQEANFRVTTQSGTIDQIKQDIQDLGTSSSQTQTSSPDLSTMTDQQLQDIINGK